MTKDMASERAVVNGPASVSAVPASIPDAGGQCTMGVGCDESGVCYASAHGRPDQCPHYEATHTAGPWFIETGHTQAGDLRYWQVTDGQDAICCNQFCYAGDSEANARLIASAPDLLAVMEALLNTSGARKEFHAMHYYDAIIAAEKVIAKAKG